MNEVKTATYFLHHELGVAFSTSNNHVHPDPHGFRRGSDHIINPVVSLYAEGEGGIWALDQGQEEDSQTEDSPPQHADVYQYKRNTHLMCIF